MFHFKKLSRKQLFCSIWQVLPPASSQAESQSPRRSSAVEAHHHGPRGRDQLAFPIPCPVFPKALLGCDCQGRAVGKMLAFCAGKGPRAPPRDAVCWFPQSCDALKSDFGQKDFVVNLQNSYTNVISCTK